MIKVWAIPLAEKGFVPTGPGNPVRWYVERLDTGKVDYWQGYASKSEAENAARNLGFDVKE